MSITIGGIMVAASIVSAGDTLTITGTGFPHVNTGEYVQNGLIAYYDGINNVGTGLHDDNSTIWKDLSGMGNDVTIKYTDGDWAETTIDTPAEISGWTCNGFEFPNNVFFKRDVVAGLPVENANYSVEIVLTPSNSGTFKTDGLVGWGKAREFFESNKIRFHDGKNKFRNYWWDCDLDFEINDINGARQMSITYDNNIGRKVYAEGGTATILASHVDNKCEPTHKDPATGINKNTTPGEPLYIGHTGHFFNDANEWANGTLIHSIRIYDRPLTTTDITTNYNVDKARYISPSASPMVVKIGSEPCKCLTIISATEIRCILPPNSGVQPVTVSYEGNTNVKIGEVSYKSIWLNGKKPKWLFVNGKLLKAAWYNGQRVF
jgi:hypothetical protein